MVEARLRQAHRGRVRRWTVAAALLAGAVTVLAACSSGGATVGSEPVVRGDVTSGVSAVAGASAGEVVVSWSKKNGLGYAVQVQSQTGGSWNIASGGCGLGKTGVSNKLTCTSTGLPAGTYTFKVAPITTKGVGTFIESNAATISGATTESTSSSAATIPGAPSITSVTAVGSSSATVVVTAPADGGSPITTYTATSDPAGGSGTASQAGSITVTGLTGGTSYTFTVKATNAVGTSLASAPSGPVTPVKTYAVGDAGPGGGTVFYVLASGFTCGLDLMSTCNYLEAAPSNSGTIKWCSNTTSSVAGTGTAIGTGAKNTAAMQTACTSGAAQSATGTTSGGKSDWYLPSKDELQALYNAWYNRGLTGELWSSSQGAAASNAWALYWEDGEVGSPSKGLVTSVRAVRAF